MPRRPATIKYVTPAYAALMRRGNDTWINMSTVGCIPREVLKKLECLELEDGVVFVCVVDIEITACAKVGG
jgi:hypothetical protein